MDFHSGDSGCVPASMCYCCLMGDSPQGSCPDSPCSYPHSTHLPYSCCAWDGQLLACSACSASACMCCASIACLSSSRYVSYIQAWSPPRTQLRPARTNEHRGARPRVVRQEPHIHARMKEQAPSLFLRATATWDRQPPTRRAQLPRTPQAGRPLTAADLLTTRLNRGG